MKTTQQSKQDCLTLCLAGRRHDGLLHFSPAQPAPALTSHQAPKIALLEKVTAWWSLMVQEQSRASPRAVCSSAFPSSASRAGSVSLSVASRDAPRDGARTKPCSPVDLGKGCHAASSPESTTGPPAVATSQHVSMLMPAEEGQQRKRDDILISKPWSRSP